MLKLICFIKSIEAFMSLKPLNIVLRNSNLFNLVINAFLGTRYTLSHSACGLNSNLCTKLRDGVV